MKRTLRYKTVKASQTAKEAKDLLKSKSSELPTEQVTLESMSVQLYGNSSWYDHAFHRIAEFINRIFYW